MVVAKSTRRKRDQPSAHRHERTLGSGMIGWEDRYMHLPQHVAEQLSGVPRSSDGYCEFAPCRVAFRPGEVLDRVYLVERAAFRRMWGETEATVMVADVEEVEDSPLRLPAPLANVLYEAGESGMGYTPFTVGFRDGSALPFVVGNAVDFPNWPPGVEPGDVVDVQPHAGREFFATALLALTRAADLTPGAYTTPRVRPSACPCSTAERSWDRLD